MLVTANTAPSEGMGSPHASLPTPGTQLCSGRASALPWVQVAPCPPASIPALLFLTADLSHRRPFTCLRGQRFSPMVISSILCEV